jgi:transposase
MCSDWAVSIRKACGAIGFDRSTFRYKSRRTDQVAVAKRIREIWPAAGFVDTKIRSSPRKRRLDMTRRKLSREFKIEAVRLVTDRGVAVAQAARDMDVAKSVLRRWMRELTAAPAAAFPGNGQMRADLAEIAALKKEVARLRAERDIVGPFRTSQTKDVALTG